MRTVVCRYIVTIFKLKTIFFQKKKKLLRDLSSYEDYHNIVCDSSLAIKIKYLVFK